MSVIDELRGLEDRVAQRMAELRPLVDEYRQLEQVAERLGLSEDRTSARPSPTRVRGRRARANGSAGTDGTAGRGRSTAARSSGRSRDGGRRDQLLAVVRDEPGITVREAGSRLGVDPTSLYRIVHKLEQDGALRKNGRQLLPG